MTTATRVPARLIDYMSGSQAYYTREGDPAAYDLIHRLCGAKARKDGSVHLPLADDERAIVLDYAESMATASQDDAGRDGNMAALGELNSARAVIRALTPRAAAGSPATAAPVSVESRATEPPRDGGLCSYDCGIGRKPDYCKEPAGHPLPHWSTSGR